MANLNGKAFIYLLIAIISLFCFIYSIIDYKESFVLYIELYTTIGCFIFYIGAFYKEIKNIKVTTSETPTGIFIFIINYIFSCKFLFSILLASFFKFIILDLLLLNKSNFNLPFLTVLTTWTTKVILPFLNILNLIYNIRIKRITNIYDITAMTIIFIVFAIINLFLRLLIFNTNSSFGKIMTDTSGDALLCLVFAISGLPLHDYFIDYKSNESLLG